VNSASIVQYNETEVHFNASINGRLGIVRTNAERNFIMTLKAFLGVTACALQIGTTVSKETFASFFRILFFVEDRYSMFLRNPGTRLSNKKASYSRRPCETKHVTSLLSLKVSRARERSLPGSHVFDITVTSQFPKNIIWLTI
jgi:hypothetical protein